MPELDDIEIDEIESSDLPEDEEQAPEELTPEEKLERLKTETARFEPFKPFLDQLESDPSKIYDLRAAMSGQAPRTQEAPQAQPTRVENLSPEQLKAMNEQVTAMIFEGRGLEAVALIADKISENRMADMTSRNAPIMDAQAEAFIDTYRSRKKDGMAPGLFRAIEVEFEEECKDLDRHSLVTKPAAQRARELDRRWNSAAGIVLQSKVKTSTGRASAGGNGGSVMGGGGRRAESPVGDRERAIMRRAGIDDAEIKAFERELQEGAR